jgi:methyl-accepting chemotaxis protein
MSTSVDEIATATQRMVTAVAEQAKGAHEIARAMEGARKHAVQNARSIAEQALAARELDAGMRDVARISAEITAAASEHAQGVGVLVKDADEVRRIAKQSARAVGEQADAVEALAASAVRQTTMLQSVLQASNEQATTTAQVAQAMRDVRGRAREIAAALTVHARSAAATVADVEIVTREGSSVRAATAQQLELVADLAVRTGSPAAEPSA